MNSPYQIVVMDREEGNDDESCHSGKSNDLSRISFTSYIADPISFTLMNNHLVLGQFKNYYYPLFFRNLLLLMSGCINFAIVFGGTQYFQWNILAVVGVAAVFDVLIVSLSEVALVLGKKNARKLGLALIV